MSTDGSILKDLPLGSDVCLQSTKELLENNLDAAVWETGNSRDSYDAVLGTYHNFVRVQSISLLLHDGFQEQMVLKAASGIPHSVLPSEQFGSADALNWASPRTTIPQFSNDLATDPRSGKKWAIWWSEALNPNPLRHAVFVPFCGDLELRGVLRFFNRLSADGLLSGSGFTVNDIKILEALSRIITIQLNKVWLAERLEMINRSINALLNQATLEDVARGIASTGTELANAAGCAVLLPDIINVDSIKLLGSHGFRQDHSGLVVPSDKSLMGRVAKQGRILEEEDLQSAPEAFSQGPGKREGMASFVALPLRTITNPAPGEERRHLGSGILIAYSRLPRKFHRSTRNLLQQFALSTGSIIENHWRAQESEGLRHVLTLAAHSLRNPLERVQSALSKIRNLDTGSLTSEIRTAFLNLALADRRLTTMLYSRKGLIEVTGLENVQVNLGKLVMDCVARNSPQAWEKKIVIKVREAVMRLPEIKGDVDKLDLVFENIIENARKYSWKNQEITIYGEAPGNNTVKICISDRGLGIPEAMRSQIFESFTRSDIRDRTRHIRGTGLGLYVSRLIVEAHGGTISFKSVPFLSDPERRLAYEGYETTFIVSLPIERNS